MTAALTLLACLFAAAAAPVERVERPEFIAALDKGHVVLTARGGFHINRQYPLRFSHANGAVLDRAQFSFEPCANEPKEACVGHAPVPLPPGLRIDGTLAFSVCDPERCLIEKIRLASSLR